MSITLGIDIGGSTTKIVGLKNNSLVGVKQVSAADQMTALFGAIGSFLRDNRLGLEEISLMAVTGVGSSYINEEKIYGIKTIKVNEFSAIGHGACFLSGLHNILVVSMGTGTTLVRVNNNDITRVGGTGVGGGTILGLSSLMLGKSDIDAIIALALSGNLRNIDLMVSDIIGDEIPSLPADLTAANFGNIKSTACDADIALGIINMVFEVIGMCAVLVSKSSITANTSIVSHSANIQDNKSFSDVILTGTLATFPQANDVFSKFTKITGLNFIIPENAVFATALGAVLESER